MPRLRTNQAVWLLILAIALAVRVGAGLAWQAHLGDPARLYFGDSVSYWQLGQAIVRGDPYQYVSPDYRVFRTPGYPVMLAGLFKVVGDDPPVWTARALSAVLGTAAVGIVGWWATRLFDARAGLWAGWIAALYPTGVAMGVFVLSEAPFAPFMVLQLAVWGMAVEAPSSRRALLWGALGGVTAAMATLIRPSWLLFTPFALGVGLLFFRQRRRQAIVGLTMLAGLAVGMIPWWIHNYQVTGRFVATTLQTGASLYDGLNPAATGASEMSFVPQFAAAERAAEAADVESDGDVYEYRLDRRMRRAALDWARAHPGRVVELAGIKVWRTWNLWPNEAAFRSWPLRLLVLVTYLPLMGLAVWGAWRFSSCGWPYVLAWLPAIYFTLLHAVFTGSLRYREPAVLALTVLAAGVLARSKRRDVTAVEPVRGLPLGRQAG